MIAQNDLIKLITIANTGKDADGFPIEEVLQETEMFSYVQSVKRSEYYAALKDGIVASKTIVINSDDYDGCLIKKNDKKYRPNLVEIDSEKFSIIRLYQKDDYTMELTLQEAE